MFNFNNNNKKDSDLPLQDLQELFQRIGPLERKCHHLERRIAELEAQADSSEAREETQESEVPDEVRVTVTGLDADNPGSVISEKMPLTQPEMPKPAAKTLFLAAPTSDGAFSQATDHEQVGKSIYRLTTSDGQNGSFIMMDSPDAIATAMISVSQFVKPACKISGNTAQQPRHIITEEEGAASREGTGWKITRKAVVRFE